MAEKGFKRKLAAILSADVEGHSRSMNDGKDATILTLTVYRAASQTLFSNIGGVL